MAVAKFMSARLLGAVRNQDNHKWRLSTFSMQVGNNNYGYFLLRTELARIFRSRKDSGRFTGISGCGSKDAPYAGKYQFVKHSDGTLELGCQQFAPQAVETLKAWALAGE